jgi:hypothetical protein
VERRRSGLRDRATELGASATLAVGVGLVGVLALVNLGYGLAPAILIVAAMGIGGLVDLPTGPGGPALRERPATRIGLNAGGCLIPLGVAVERGLRLPPSVAGPLAVSVGLVALLSFLLARPVAGRGIVLSWPLTGLLAAALGLTLATTPSRDAAPFAFVAGFAGPLLGAEVPLLPALGRLGVIRAGIGGSGLFDGLVWSGFLAAVLGSPSHP